MRARSSRTRSTSCSSRPSASPTRGFRDEVLPGRRAHASGCSSSTRRTASATGATTSAPTTAASRASSSCCRAGVPVLCTTATANDRVVDDIVAPARRRPRRRSAARSTARASRSHVARPARRRPSAWRGWPTTIPDAARHAASSTASPSPTPSRVAGWLRVRRHRRRAPTAATPTTSDREAVEQRAAGATTSRSSSPPPRSAWASTSPTSRFVIHFQSPGLADRLLPAGRPRRPRARPRAGGPAARRTRTRDIQDYFIRTAFPPRRAGRGGRRRPARRRRADVRRRDRWRR